MVFRVAAQIRTDDTIIADGESACTAEVRIFPESDMMSDTDKFTGVVKREGYLEIRMTANPGVIPNG